MANRCIKYAVILRTITQSTQVKLVVHIVTIILSFIVCAFLNRRKIQRQPVLLHENRTLWRLFCNKSAHIKLYHDKELILFTGNYAFPVENFSRISLPFLMCCVCDYNFSRFYFVKRFIFFFALHIHFKRFPWYSIVAWEDTKSRTIKKKHTHLCVYDYVIVAVIHCILYTCWASFT